VVRVKDVYQFVYMNNAGMEGEVAVMLSLYIRMAGFGSSLAFKQF
jgi:hypothetical protein